VRPSVREPGDLDAEVSHDLDATQLKAVLELQDRQSVQHGREGVGRAERWRLALDRLYDPGRRDQAADDPLPIVGLEPINPHGGVRQPFPDRQQQPGDDLGLPSTGEVGPSEVCAGSTRICGYQRPV